MLAPDTTSSNWASSRFFPMSRLLCNLTSIGLLVLYGTIAASGHGLHSLTHIEGHACDRGDHHECCSIPDDRSPEHNHDTETRPLVDLEEDCAFCLYLAQGQLLGLVDDLTILPVTPARITAFWMICPSDPQDPSCSPRAPPTRIG